MNVVAPGTLYGDRVNQIDVTVGRPFKTGRVRSTVNLDRYNASKSNPVLTVNNTYNAAAVANPSRAWLASQSILTPRFGKIGISIDF